MSDMDWLYRDWCRRNGLTEAERTRLLAWALSKEDANSVISLVRDEGWTREQLSLMSTLATPLILSSWISYQTGEESEGVRQTSKFLEELPEGEAAILLLNGLTMSRRGLPPHSPLPSILSNLLWKKSTVKEHVKALVELGEDAPEGWVLEIRKELKALDEESELVLLTSLPSKTLELLGNDGSVIYELIYHKAKRRYIGAGKSYDELRLARSSLDVQGTERFTALACAVSSLATYLDFNRGQVNWMEKSLAYALVQEGDRAWNGVALSQAAARLTGTTRWDLLKNKLEQAIGAAENITGPTETFPVPTWDEALAALRVEGADKERALRWLLLARDRETFEATLTHPDLTVETALFWVKSESPDLADFKLLIQGRDVPWQSELLGAWSIGNLKRLGFLDVMNTQAVTYHLAPSMKDEGKVLELISLEVELSDSLLRLLPIAHLDKASKATELASGLIHRTLKGSTTALLVLEQLWKGRRGTLGEALDAALDTTYAQTNPLVVGE